MKIIIIIIIIIINKQAKYLGKGLETFLPSVYTTVEGEREQGCLILVLCFLIIFMSSIFMS